MMVPVDYPSDKDELGIPASIHPVLIKESNILKHD